MSTDSETRPIKGGDVEFPPFQISRKGVVTKISGRRKNRQDSMSPKNAVKHWKNHGGRPLYAKTPDPLNELFTGARERGAVSECGVRMKLETHDLVVSKPNIVYDPQSDQLRPSGTSTVLTRWLYVDQRPKGSEPRAILLPPQLPLAGSAEDGWYGLGVEGLFEILFHGPSLAASVFCENT